MKIFEKCAQFLRQELCIPGIKQLERGFGQHDRLERAAPGGEGMGR